MGECKSELGHPLSFAWIVLNEISETFTVYGMVWYGMVWEDID